MVGIMNSKVKADLERKHPEQMKDLSSLCPSGQVHEAYHFISCQLSMKRSSAQLERFLNSQEIARIDENTYKFCFPLLRTYSRFQRNIHDYTSKRMKSEANQTLLALYCPQLARSIFIVEKAWQRKQSNRFWVDNSEGVSESQSSLNMMILMLIEAIIVDENTAIHQKDHWSLVGFQGSPFPNDSDHTTKMAPKEEIQTWQQWL